ncbi:MAG: ABC transporter ATP-binding protein [Chloroflexi bacterium]|nr:ABC transporter ATP-binding protein [Chloroflexota bacterium]MDA1272291.1 ABC transporter ATP-binding protein [Chloroflexota bacterium]PKB59152.1 MAG: peptide ABC transporter ATP-binding protein [SAR202 cluster bacterium Casp-Chloro-G2]
MATLLEVKDLRTHFFTMDGVVKAVDGVSYDLEEGETLGLVGESGCGKSVSALSVMRLIPNPPGRIVGGEILLDGEDILKVDMEDMRNIRGAKIAMVFQEPMTSLNPVLTIERQLTETLQLHMGMSNDEARREGVNLLTRVGIPDPEGRIKQYPHQFSGGMRQRVMIAMALSCNPRLIIADEPTTALDVTIQAQILDLMKSLTTEFGVALIVITHNLGVVARYADRVNIMYAGKVIERGNALDIYSNPRHPYTVGLLRSVPRLDLPRRARLDPIEGQPPDLINLPAGCSFRERCRWAIDKCATDIPPLEETGDGHLSACFRSADLGPSALDLPPDSGLAE